MRLYSDERNTTIEVRCENTDCCEHNVIQELAAHQELGRAFLRDDDDIFCRGCGQEMTSV